jgi:hypothetical protein
MTGLLATRIDLVLDTDPSACRPIERGELMHSQQRIAYWRAECADLHSGQRIVVGERRCTVAEVDGTEITVA